MPPVREMNKVDGFFIRMSNGETFHQTTAQIQARLASYPGNLTKKETAYNEWLQSQTPFVKMYPAAEYDPDHPVNVDPNNLPSWRIVAGAYIGEVIMWIAIHFYNDDPLDFRLLCRNRELGPITEVWW